MTMKVTLKIFFSNLYYVHFLEIFLFTFKES